MMTVTCIDECNFIIVVHIAECIQVSSISPMLWGMFVHVQSFILYVVKFIHMATFIHKMNFHLCKIIASTWKIPVMYKIIVNEYNLIHFVSFIYVINFIHMVMFLIDMSQFQFCTQCRLLIIEYHCPPCQFHL